VQSLTTDAVIVYTAIPMGSIGIIIVDNVTVKGAVTNNEWGRVKGDHNGVEKVILRGGVDRKDLWS
jgi:hypothetical protein